MRPRSFRVGLLAATLALPVAFTATPVAASCIWLADMLPEPSTPGVVVFVGTVVSSDELTTDLTVESWYLGEPRAAVQVVGGREPDVITSVDWTPSVGESYVVVAQVVDEVLVTGTCMQSMPDPGLLDELAAVYGEPELPSAGVGSPSPSPVVTSGETPLPGSLVHGTPEPTILDD